MDVPVEGEQHYGNFDAAALMKPAFRAVRKASVRLPSPFGSNIVPMPNRSEKPEQISNIDSRSRSR